MGTWRTGIAALGLALGAIEAGAQGLGTFSWQLQPFCNVLTLTVTQNRSIYTLDGFDDQCGAGQRAPAAGIATVNPDGSIGLGIAIVTAPGGRPVHVDARISLTGLSGPWTDSVGNSGTFIPGGQAAGSPRPAPGAALPPGSVTTTAIAVGAVTRDRLAAGAVGATAIDSSQVQRRLGSPCPRGLFMTTASVTGVPTCTAGVGINTAIGQDALASNTTGFSNTAVGYQALQATTTALRSTAVGSQALRSATGDENTAVGNGGLFSLTTGFWNVAVGSSALTSNTTGSSNTAVGRLALYNATGSANIAIGADAGLNIGAGGNNILIGHPGTAADSGRIRIGAGQLSAYMAGIRGVTTTTSAIPVLIGTDGQLGTVSSSRRFKDDIHDMGDRSRGILALRPVTFRYLQAQADGSRPIDYGLVAEEVAETFPDLVARGADGEIETVHYQKLPVLLLNEVQRQQRAIEALTTRLEAVMAELAAARALARER